MTKLEPIFYIFLNFHLFYLKALHEVRVITDSKRKSEVSFVNWFTPKWPQQVFLRGRGTRTSDDFWCVVPGHCCKAECEVEQPGQKQVPIALGSVISGDT